MVRLLATRDQVEVDSKDEDDRTLLPLAAGNRHESVTRFLLTLDDADVNSEDSLVRPPLIYVAKCGQEAVV